MAKAWRLGLACSLLVAGVLPGCSTGFATYPPTPGQTASANPNGPIFETAVVAALRDVIERYPPPPELVPSDAGTLSRPERVAINLFDGVRPDVAESTAARVGGGAAPLFEETADLPTYHVTRVWLRGGRAEVDIICPVVTRRGARTTQMVTLEMQSTLGGYRVDRRREWTVGAFPAPAPFRYIRSEVLEAQEAAFRGARDTARRLTREADNAADRAAELHDAALEAEARARDLEVAALEDESQAERAAEAWADAAEARTIADEAAERARTLRVSADAAQAEADRLRPEAGRFAEPAAAGE